MIKVEVEAQTGLLQKEVAEAKLTAGKAMSVEQHKLICGMNSTMVSNQFANVEKTAEIQSANIKEHIDVQFESLNKRLDEMVKDK